MEAATWVGAIASSVTASVALAALYVALQQLAKLSHNLELSRLGTLLDIEAEMNTRKERVDEKNDEMRPGVMAATASFRKAELDTRVENWFDAVDRFAFCILAGYVPESALTALEIRYQSYFNGIVVGYPKYFRPDTSYRNILELNRKWQGQQPI
ncbi:MAG: hypothetical protein ACLQLG_12640 [Thermoguttaceae bacterium]